MDFKKIIGTPIIDITESDTIKDLAIKIVNNQKNLYEQIYEVAKFIADVFVNDTDPSIPFDSQVAAGKVVSVTLSNNILIVKYKADYGIDHIKFNLYDLGIANKQINDNTLDSSLIIPKYWGNLYTDYDGTWKHGDYWFDPSQNALYVYNVIGDASGFQLVDAKKGKALVKTDDTTFYVLQDSKLTKIAEGDTIELLATEVDRYADYILYGITETYDVVETYLGKNKKVVIKHLDNRDYRYITIVSWNDNNHKAFGISCDFDNNRVKALNYTVYTNPETYSNSRYKTIIKSTPVVEPVIVDLVGYSTDSEQESYIHGGGSEGDYVFQEDFLYRYSEAKHAWEPLRDGDCILYCIWDHVLYKYNGGSMEELLDARSTNIGYELSPDSRDPVAGYVIYNALEEIKRTIPNLGPIDTIVRNSDNLVKNRAIYQAIQDVLHQISQIPRITIDKSLNGSSSNPVENKVIYQQLISVEQLANNASDVANTAKTQAENNKSAIDELKAIKEVICVTFEQPYNSELPTGDDNDVPHSFSNNTYWYNTYTNLLHVGIVKQQGPTVKRTWSEGVPLRDHVLYVFLRDTPKAKVLKNGVLTQVGADSDCNVLIATYVGDSEIGYDGTWNLEDLWIDTTNNLLKQVTSIAENVPTFTTLSTPLKLVITSSKIFAAVNGTTTLLVPTENYNALYTQTMDVNNPNSLINKIAAINNDVLDTDNPNSLVNTVSGLDTRVADLENAGGSSPVSNSNLLIIDHFVTDTNTISTPAIGSNAYVYLTKKVYEYTPLGWVNKGTEQPDKLYVYSDSENNVSIIKDGKLKTIVPPVYGGITFTSIGLQPVNNSDTKAAAIKKANNNTTTLNTYLNSHPISFLIVDGTFKFSGSSTPGLSTGIKLPANGSLYLKGGKIITTFYTGWLFNIDNDNISFYVDSVSFEGTITRTVTIEGRSYEISDLYDSHWNHIFTSNVQKHVFPPSDADGATNTINDFIVYNSSFKNVGIIKTLHSLVSTADVTPTVINGNTYKVFVDGASPVYCGINKLIITQCFVNSPHATPIVLQGGAIFKKCEVSYNTDVNANGPFFIYDRQSLKDVQFMPQLDLNVPFYIHHNRISTVIPAHPGTASAVTIKGKVVYYTDNIIDGFVLGFVTNGRDTSRGTNINPGDEHGDAKDTIRVKRTYKEQGESDYMNIRYFTNTGGYYDTYISAHKLYCLNNVVKNAIYFKAGITYQTVNNQSVPVPYRNRTIGSVDDSALAIMYAKTIYGDESTAVREYKNNKYIWDDDYCYTIMSEMYDNYISHLALADISGTHAEDKDSWINEQFVCLFSWFSSHDTDYKDAAVHHFDFSGNVIKSKFVKLIGMDVYMNNALQTALSAYSYINYSNNYIDCYAIRNPLVSMRPATENNKFAPLTGKKVNNTFVTNYHTVLWDTNSQQSVEQALSGTYNGYTYYQWVQIIEGLNQDKTKQYLNYRVNGKYMDINGNITMCEYSDLNITHYHIDNTYELQYEYADSNRSTLVSIKLVKYVTPDVTICNNKIFTIEHSFVRLFDGNCPYGWGGNRSVNDAGTPVIDKYAFNKVIIKDNIFNSAYSAIPGWCKEYVEKNNIIKKDEAFKTLFRASDRLIPPDIRYTNLADYCDVDIWLPSEFRDFGNNDYGIIKIDIAKKHSVSKIFRCIPHYTSSVPLTFLTPYCDTQDHKIRFVYKHNGYDKEVELNFNIYDGASSVFDTTIKQTIPSSGVTIDNVTTKTLDRQEVTIHTVVAKNDLNHNAETLFTLLTNGDDYDSDMTLRVSTSSTSIYKSGLFCAQVLCYDCYGVDGELTIIVD